MNASTDRAKRIAKLERALIKTALVRYREWMNENGSLPTWGKEPNVRTKKAWAHLNATKALYEAKRK